MEKTVDSLAKELNPIARVFQADTNQTRRLILKLGGVSGFIGAVLVLVANALHPHPTDGQLEALFSGIVQNQNWVLVHLLLIFGLVFTYGSLMALTLTIREEPGSVLAGFAGLATILGGTLFLVSTAMDGFSINQLSRTWYEAAPSEKTAALNLLVAFDHAQFAVYSMAIILFLGVAIFLYGLSIVLSKAYPSYLGWLAMLSGIGGFAEGVVQCFGGPTFRDFEMVFALFSVLTTLWLFIISVQMWRKPDKEFSNQ